jgi:hypothetical protein
MQIPVISDHAASYSSDCPQLSEKWQTSKPNFRLIFYRYIFYKETQSKLVQINFMQRHRKEFSIKIDDFMFYVDHVNKRIYFYGNSYDNIHSMDYNGEFFKPIQTSAMNVGALAVFGDFVYHRSMNTNVIQETNIFTGVVHQNIYLPKPFSRLMDLAVIEQAQYPTGKGTTKAGFLLHHFAGRLPNVSLGACQIFRLDVIFITIFIIRNVSCRSES